MDTKGILICFLKRKLKYVYLLKGKKENVRCMLEHIFFVCRSLMMMGLLEIELRSMNGDKRMSMPERLYIQQ